ncbi:hypothetical protein ACC674_37215, partial [Rhizobium ruizarguesonis]
CESSCSSFHPRANSAIVLLLFAEAHVQRAFDRAFARNPDGFVEALLDARDIVGTYLAETLWALDPDFLDYGDVARTMLKIDRNESGGQFARIISKTFSR